MTPAMKIVSFGATGGTGKNVVEQALAAGHDVVAVARNPAAVPPRPRLTVVQGDVMDLYAVKRAVVGADAVISTIGPKVNGDPGSVISMGTRNMLAACRDEHVKRFVFESGIMMSNGKELSMVGAFAAMLFRAIYPKLHEEKVMAENAIKESHVEWVIVRPPALNHSPAKGKYTAGPDARIFPPSSLSHADCAACLLRAATTNEWVNKIVNVGN
jgi:putative NADH-flavin reductase